MTLLATSLEIQTARNALHVLRNAVAEARSVAGRGGARRGKETLVNYLKSAETAVSVISSSAPFHDGIRAIVNDFERLKETTRELTLNLSTVANAAGPFRSAMTTAEKTTYVIEHGEEAFLSLPL